MGETYREGGHNHFGAKNIRNIEAGLANGDPWQLASGIASRGVQGSARDVGRAIASQMYREGDGIPISPDVFMEPTNDGLTSVYVDEAGMLRDTGMTDEQHEVRIGELAGFPSMSARIMEASGIEIPPVIESDKL